jgi:hypothetical protein
VPDQVILDDLPTLATGMGNGGFMWFPTLGPQNSSKSRKHAQQVRAACPMADKAKAAEAKKKGNDEFQATS